MPFQSPTLQRRSARRASEAGMSLLEVLIAASVVAVALLSHAAATLSGHRLTKADERRSVAIQAIRQLLERIRAEEDWGGLYARLRTQEGLARTRSTPGLPQGFLPPTAYSPDYVVPEDLGTVGVFVDVPEAAPAGGGAPVLREDADLPAFGLPFDLNGDGLVDANSRNADYRALPLIVSFRYEAAGAPPVVMSVTTWLTGER